jgi:CheY-like chemotaxis protein
LLVLYVGPVTPFLASNKKGARAHSSPSQLARAIPVTDGRHYEAVQDIECRIALPGTRIESGGRHHNKIKIGNDVEDNPEVADASMGLLEQLGCEVRCVADAEAALQALERDTTIDLVLSDIVMPGRMDGLALARAVKEKYPGLPVLLATGYSEAAQGVDAEFPILRKPYQMGELSKAVATLMSASSDRYDAKLVQFSPGRRDGASSSGTPEA